MQNMQYIEFEEYECAQCVECVYCRNMQNMYIVGICRICRIFRLHIPCTAAYSAYSIDILWHMMHRIRHFWGNPRPHRVTFVFTLRSWLDIQNIMIGVRCLFLHGHLYPRNCSNPIARSWCSFCCHASLSHISAENGQNLVLQVLLLFSIDINIYTGMKTHDCAYVSVLEEYKGPRRPGHILHILYISAYSAYSVYDSVWLFHTFVGCVPVHHCLWA